MALQQFRIDGKANNQQEAIEQLTLALAHWEDPTASIEKYNVAECQINLTLIFPGECIFEKLKMT